MLEAYSKVEEKRGDENDKDCESHMKRESSLVSRNVTVLGRRTSVRLEPEMWSGLKEIAKKESCKIHDICSLIELRKNPQSSLTAAIRVFIMLYFRSATSAEGHAKAGHGSFKNMLARARVSREEIERKSGNVTGAPDRYKSENIVRFVPAHQPKNLYQTAAE